MRGIPKKRSWPTPTTPDGKMIVRLTDQLVLGVLCTATRDDVERDVQMVNKIIEEACLEWRMAQRDRRERQDGRNSDTYNHAERVYYDCRTCLHRSYHTFEDAAQKYVRVRWLLNGFALHFRCVHADHFYGGKMDSGHVAQTMKISRMVRDEKLFDRLGALWTRWWVNNVDIEDMQAGWHVSIPARPYLDRDARIVIS